MTCVSSARLAEAAGRDPGRSGGHHLRRAAGAATLDGYIEAGRRPRPVRAAVQGTRRDALAPRPSRTRPRAVGGERPIHRGQGLRRCAARHPGHRPHGDGRRTDGDDDARRPRSRRHQGRARRAMATMRAGVPPFWPTDGDEQDDGAVFVSLRPQQAQRPVELKTTAALRRGPSAGRWSRCVHRELPSGKVDALGLSYGRCATRSGLVSARSRRSDAATRTRPPRL